MYINVKFAYVGQHIGLATRAKQPADQLLIWMFSVAQLDAYMKKKLNKHFMNCNFNFII